MRIFLAVCLLSLCGVYGCEGGFGGFSRTPSSQSEPSAYLESPHHSGAPSSHPQQQEEEEEDLPPHQLAVRSRPEYSSRGEYGRRAGYVRQRAEYSDQDGGVYGQDGRFYRRTKPNRRQWN